MINEHTEKRKTMQSILIGLLLILLIASIVYACREYFSIGVDDFTRRYRESKYVLHGISPFDIIYGNKEVVSSIGELPRNSGYPSWSMVIGILTNFAFLPENIAYLLTGAVMVLCIALVGIVLYRFGKQKKWSEEQCLLQTLCGLCISGLWTGLSWLNFGSVIGVLLFLFVLCEEKYPYVAGILLGISSIKPVLAAPFFLAVLLRKNWKCFLSATVIPLVAMLICFALTKVSPLTMLAQMGAEGNTYWNNSFFANFNLLLGYGLSTKTCNFLSTIFGIGLALLLWVWMHPVKNKYVYYSIPAVISGFWMYSQEHDRSVQLILLVALFLYLYQDKGTLKRTACFFIFTTICYRRFLIFFFENFTNVEVVFQAVDMLFDLSLICALIMLIVHEKDKLKYEPH